jgi:hypothetical protein
MRVLAFQPIGAKSVLVARLIVPDLEEQRRAAIPVPHLGGVDAMPARDLARPEQIEDRRRVRAAFMAWFIPEGLAEKPRSG